MWTMSQVLCGIFLVSLSILDIRYRQVPLWFLLTGGVFVVLSALVESPENTGLMIAGGVVGGIFLFISKITREAFGYGDSILIVILGAFLGMWNMFYLLILAFSLSGIFAICGMMLRKFARRTAFPFIPFLTLAYLGVILL
ncbi:MAG: A24 family peptidase [Hespellia sp.]|nr:A24 family peptidase [Hespellia sp.]